MRTCPGLSHYRLVERVLANRREVVEKLARRRITDRGGEGEGVHARPPCAPSHLCDMPKQVY